MLLLLFTSLPERRSLHWLEQAFAQFSLPSETLEHNLSIARLNDVFNLGSPLFIRVNSVIFPVVLVHELGMRVKTAPVIFGIGKDLFYVLIVLASSDLVFFHALVYCALLCKYLLDWFWVLNDCEIWSRSKIGVNLWLSIIRSSSSWLAVWLCSLIISSCYSFTLFLNLWESRLVICWDIYGIILVVIYPAFCSRRILHSIAHHLCLWWSFLDCKLEDLHLCLKITWISLTANITRRWQRCISYMAWRRLLGVTLI